MATQTFSYAYQWHCPLPAGYSDEAIANSSLFCLEVTGPASSVADGMTIASIGTDLSYIAAAWSAGDGAVTYRERVDLAAAGAAAATKIAIEHTSTGLDAGAGVDLSSHIFHLVGIGSGPFASAVD